MSDKQGQGHLGVGKPSVADEKGGTSGGGVSGDDGDARASRDREDGRPACLPLPYPPRLPSKRTLTDSVMDSTVARFEASCKLTEQGTAAAPSAARMALATVSSAANTVRTPSWDKNATPADLEARERTAQAWIEAVSGRACVEYQTKQFARNLMSGEILCALVNAIRPGTIPHVHESQLGFEQMENINSFLSACCKLGVQAHALVDTADVFEMRDTAKVVECVHALGSAVQVSCPEFGGPHLGPAADPTLVAAVPPTDDDEDEDGDDGDGKDNAVADDDDDEDGAFGDFWRASVSRTGGNAPREGRGGRVGGVAGDNTLVLNMQDVERPRSTRRGFTTTVGSITDLDPPATLSARARQMCPTEMVNSPRALVFNADPVGHPTRSPTLRAAWESNATNGGSAAAGRSAWGTDAYPAKRAAKATSNLSATSSRGMTLSPAGIWGTGAGTAPREGIGKSASPAAASANSATTAAVAASHTGSEDPEGTEEGAEETGGGGGGGR
ncbi:unnamed protein product [Ectocarpus sp. 6 AP-2014]